MADTNTTIITEVQEVVIINEWANGLPNQINEVFTGEFTHSDALWKELLLADNLRKVIPQSSVWTFDIKLSGATQYAAKFWSYLIKGVIIRDNATTIQIVNSYPEVLAESVASFTAMADTENTTYALKILVKDANSGGDVVKWSAVLNASPVNFI